MSIKRIRSGFGSAQAKNVNTTASTLQFGTRDGGVTRYDGMGNVYIEDEELPSVVTATQTALTLIKSLYSSTNINSKKVSPNDKYSHILGKAPRRWWRTLGAKHTVIAHDTEGLCWVDGTEYVTRAPIIAGTVHNRRLILAIYTDNAIYIDSYKLTQPALPYRGNDAGKLDISNYPNGGDSKADRITEFINHAVIFAPDLNLSFSENKVFGYSSGAFNWNGTSLIITKVSANLRDSKKVSTAGTEILSDGTGGVWPSSVIVQTAYNAPTDAPFQDVTFTNKDSISFRHEYITTHLYDGTTLPETGVQNQFFIKWDGSTYVDERNDPILYPYDFNSPITGPFYRWDPPTDEQITNGYVEATILYRYLEVFTWNIFSLSWDYSSITTSGQRWIDSVFHFKPVNNYSIRVGDSYKYSDPIILETFMDYATGEIRHLILNEDNPSNYGYSVEIGHQDPPTEFVDTLYKLDQYPDRVIDYSLIYPELVNGIDYEFPLQTFTPGKFNYYIANSSLNKIAAITAGSASDDVVTFNGQQGLVVTDEASFSDVWRYGSVVFSHQWSGTTGFIGRVSPTSNKLNTMCVQIQGTSGNYNDVIFTTDGYVYDELFNIVGRRIHPIFREP